MDISQIISDFWGADYYRPPPINRHAAPPPPHPSSKNVKQQRRTECMMCHDAQQSRNEEFCRAGKICGAWRGGERIYKDKNACRLQNNTLIVKGGRVADPVLY